MGTKKKGAMHQYQMDIVPKSQKNLKKKKKTTKKNKGVK